MSKVINKDLNQNIELKTYITTLNVHSNDVYCLTVLNDGRLVSGSEDKSIIIYNKYTYQPNIIIKEHNYSIKCLIQLKNGILASCSDDETIKLFNIKENEYELIQTLNLHSSGVSKIYELSNNYLVSGSYDKTIIFYIKDDIKYKKDYSISSSYIINNIIETKQNEIVYSTWGDEIIFFDLNKRKNKLIIENITAAWNSFCMINNDLLLIGGRNMIYILNINECKKIREINIPNSGYIYATCKLNCNIIIIGDDYGNLMKWRIEKDNLILISKKENAHNRTIYAILNLFNTHIVTSSRDHAIKIW